MRIPIFLLLALLTFPISAFAATTHYYRLIQKNTQDIIERSLIRIEDESGGQKKFHFTKEENGHSQTEEYTLSKDYDTLFYSVKNESTKTDYTGEHQGKKIIIKGTLNGAPADQTIAIDDDPFYAFPKFNLIPFVLSQEKKRTFWAIRTDNLNAFKMFATRAGKDTIILNGEKAAVEKVFVTTQNPLFRIFKRVYYFRASDGLFLRQEYPDGRVRELFKEE